MDERYGQTELLAFFWFMRRVLSLRYKLEIKGLEEVLSRGREGILLLPNHPAIIDPVILLAHFYPIFKMRTLADKDQASRVFIRSLAARMGTRMIPAIEKYGPAARKNIEAALQRCVEWLQSGDNLMLYPTGHANHEWFDEIGSNSAVETILRAIPNVRVVLMRTKGLWGSSFSWASGKEPTVSKAAKRGAPGLLASGLFFAPKRQVTIEFVEPDDVPRQGSRSEINRYLENFYNEIREYNTYVPYSLFEGGGEKRLPEPPSRRLLGDAGSVPRRTKELVYTQLRVMTGYEEIKDDQILSHELGMDSLQRAELLLWLSKEFGFPSSNVDALQTVTDVLLAASSRATTAEPFRLKLAPPLWSSWKFAKKKAILPQGDTLTDVFLEQAAIDPKRPYIADQTSGMKTYCDVITGIFVLKPIIEALEGEYLGIMMPASVGANVAYYSMMFARKVPVWINWTVGLRSVELCLNKLNVAKILTSRKLVDILTMRGVELDKISDKFVYLEDIGASVSIFTKLKALFWAKTNWSSLKSVKPAQRAAVLFTSGSEALPKLVPLTHKNIITNVRDIYANLELHQDDTWIGMLPPFHSFGLTSCLALAPCTGTRVAYHPNPTDAGALSQIIKEYGVSLLVGTPTFLGAITQAATKEQLTSLRLALTGAEACQPLVYENIEKKCPHVTVIEGYGITECSPVISFNDEHAPQQYTVGKVLNSVEWAIVDLEMKKRVPKGEKGLMLLRGPSIFDGYLAYDGSSPFVQFEGESWYRTGDLLSIDEKDVLTFRGRLKRFVKIGGEMVSLPAIEAVLLEGLQKGEDSEEALAVSSTGDDRSPEIVLFTTCPVDRKKVNEIIRDGGLSPLHNVRRVITIDEIPLLGSGKTNYRYLSESLRNGQWD